MQADATDFAAQATGLRHDCAATGPLATEEALQFQSTGVLPFAAHQAAAAGQSPLTLLQLPADVPGLPSNCSHFFFHIIEYIDVNV